MKIGGNRKPGNLPYLSGAGGGKSVSLQLCPGGEQTGLFVLLGMNPGKEGEVYGL